MAMANFFSPALFKEPIMGSDNHPVREVLRDIIENSFISVEQVKTLEDFVRQDWVIDKDEAKLLLRVNHALKENHDGCVEWTSFFVTSISRLVIFDMNSPGEIDTDEGDWLAAMLDEYSVGNNSEKQMLLELQKLSSSIKGKLGDRIQPAQ